MNRTKFPRDKKVFIIADYPYQNEIDRDVPFCAASNLTMLSDLHKVGIKQSDCHLTYLFYERAESDDYDYNKQFCKSKDLDKKPKTIWHKLEHQKDLYISDYVNTELENLLHEIELVDPKLIIITGKWAFFFLTGVFPYSKTQGKPKSPKPNGGLFSYRASIMQLWEGFGLPKSIVVPILPSVTKQRDPSKIPIITWDYRKLGDVFYSLYEKNEPLTKWLKPKRTKFIGESVNIILAYLMYLLTELDKTETLVAIDIETRQSTIDCIGFAHKIDEGICIPFSTLDNPNIWTFEEELYITLLILKVLKHKNLQIVGQNYSYDSQYIHKFYFIETNPFHDTMIANHVLFNYMPKDLAFLASVYVDTYSHWKNMQENIAEGVK